MWSSQIGCSAWSNSCARVLCLYRSHRRRVGALLAALLLASGVAARPQPARANGAEADWALLMLMGVIEGAATNNACEIGPGQLTETEQGGLVYTQEAYIPYEHVLADLRFLDLNEYVVVTLKNGHHLKVKIGDLQSLQPGQTVRGLDIERAQAAATYPDRDGGPAVFHPAKFQDIMRNPDNYVSRVQFPGLPQDIGFYSEFGLNDIASSAACDPFHYSRAHGNGLTVTNQMSDATLPIHITRNLTIALTGGSGKSKAEWPVNGQFTSYSDQTFGSVTAAYDVPVIPGMRLIGGASTGRIGSDFTSYGSYGSYTSHYRAVYGRVEKQFMLGAISITPMLGVQQTRVKREAFNDATGTSYEPPSTINIFQYTAGLNGTIPVPLGIANCIDAGPKSGALCKHGFLSAHVVASHTHFSGITDDPTVATFKNNYIGLNAGAGVQIPIGHYATAGADFDWFTAGDTDGWSVTASLNIDLFGLLNMRRPGPLVRALTSGKARAGCPSRALFFSRWTVLPHLPSLPATMPAEFLVSAFVTLLVVVDPLGLVPSFIAVTHGMPPQARRSVAWRAALIAALVLAGSALIGDWLLRTLSITLPAFRIAGGLLLFSIASEMVFGVRIERQSQEAEEAVEERVRNVAAFPLAVPLMAGPGAITACVLLAGRADGTAMQLAVLLGVIAVVMAVCLAVFMTAAQIARLMGTTGNVVASRLLGVLLAALAVQYVIDGVRIALG